MKKTTTLDALHPERKLPLRKMTENIEQKNKQYLGSAIVQLVSPTLTALLPKTPGFRFTVDRLGKGIHNFRRDSS